MYGVLGPYKIERYAKLPQRSKTVTTGLDSIKTTWIRVYSASNRLLGLENGWPFRRFGGGAAPPPSPLANANFPRQGRRLLWRLLGPENCGGDAGGQEVSNDVRYSPLGARVGQLLAWAHIRHRQACHRTPGRGPGPVELVAAGR